MTSVLISAALLWIFFYWIHRQDQSDRFRLKIHALNDELFDMALSGAVAFDSAAYRILRKTLSGMEDLGPKLDLVGVLSLAFLWPKANVSDASFQDEWKASCDGLNEETRHALTRLRNRMHWCIVEHAIWTSVTLIFAYVGCFAWILIRSTGILDVSREVCIRWIANLNRNASFNWLWLLLLRIDFSAWMGSKATSTNRSGSTSLWFLRQFQTPSA